MVQLCTDARMQAELQEGISVQVDFLTDLHTQLVQVDTVRFMKLLSSVLMSPKGRREPYAVQYMLDYKSIDELRIVVTNSPLLQHAINRLYLEAFQGSYQLCEEDGKRLIIITYPIKSFS